MNTPNLQATAQALLDHETEYKAKANAKGKVNGNVSNAIRKRCNSKLVVAGWSPAEADSMTRETWLKYR